MPFRVSGMAVIHAPVLLIWVAWRLAARVASANKLASVSSAAAVRAFVVSLLRPSLLRHSIKVIACNWLLAVVAAQTEGMSTPAAEQKNAVTY